MKTELAAGTSGRRWFKKAEPTQVADAIVATLERPSAREYVSRGPGTLVRALRKLPQGWTERLNAAMGGIRSSSTTSTTTQRRRSKSACEETDGLVMIDPE